MIGYTGYSNDGYILRTILESNLPVIVGGGNLGNAVAKKLCSYGIQNFCNLSLKVDDLKNTVSFLDKEPYDRYIFLLGYLDAYQYDMRIFGSLPGCMQVCYLTELYDAERITYGFYCEHIHDFDETLSYMEDEISALSMQAFLWSKINEDAAGLARYVVRPQYFGVDFISPGKDECFIDCGAFDGDTIRDFLKWSNGNYSKIIAFEPEKRNIDKLKNFIYSHDLKNVCIEQYAAYSERTRLYFKSGDEMSRVSEDGDISIKTETIDNIVDGADVTYIKMDIEGSELHALYGAQETIKRCHPILAISAYHRKEDLYALPRFIHQCWNGYKFYFRLHKEIPIDAVLYAIP